MFILSPVSSGLEFWPVNLTSIYENSELKIFTNIQFLVGISDNWPNNSFGTNAYKILESCWQYYNGLILL